MKIRFWGVRGSIPSPQTTFLYQRKLFEILKLSNKKNMSTDQNIYSFIQSLPFSLANNYGGNTTCIEISDNQDNIIIIDCGTGFRLFGNDLLKRKKTPYKVNVFFTHFHWDHIQGLPFFIPAYLPNTIMNFYSVDKNCHKILKRQQYRKNFPVKHDKMPCQKNFIQIIPGEPIQIGDITINAHSMNHPGGGTAYSFSHNQKKIVFTGDVEFKEKDIKHIKKYGDFFSEADIGIFDSQYTLEESFSKFDYGHTCYTMAINLGINWKIKKIILTHFDPNYSDENIFDIEQMAIAHAQILDEKNTQIIAAYEGLTLEL